MRVFCTGFALLLYANLTHALLKPSNTGLASAPVDNIEGLRCSDDGELLVDVSKELRESEACKPEGLAKHEGYLEAQVKFEKQDKPDKPYLCCLYRRMLCPGLTEVQVVTEKDSNEKERPTAVDCGGSKSCQDPENSVCLPKVANDPGHYLYPKRLESWKEIPVCCPKPKDKTCHQKKSSYIREPNDGECEANLGRCKTEKSFVALCSRKEVDTTRSSCCVPDQADLCPFGINPFSLKGKNGAVDWIANNSGDVDAWTKACLDLATKPEFAGAKIYISDGKCCAMAKLEEERYYGKDYADLLSDQYERFSTMSCEEDADCGEGKFCGFVISSYNNEWAKGRACFEKLQCPHETKTVYPSHSRKFSFTCSDSTDCWDSDTCVSAATTAKTKKSFGICCHKKDEDTLLDLSSSASSLLHFLPLMILLSFLE